MCVIAQRQRHSVYGVVNIKRQTRASESAWLGLVVVLARIVAAWKRSIPNKLGRGDVGGGCEISGISSELLGWCGIWAFSFMKMILRISAGWGMKGVLSVTYQLCLETSCCSLFK